MRFGNRITQTPLLHKLHLIEQITGTSKFVDYKKCVANVDCNVTATVGVEHNIAHCTFPEAVEVYAN